MGKNIYMYLQQKVVYMGTVYMTCIYNIILHVHIVVYVCVLHVILNTEIFDYFHYFRLFCTCNCRELHMHIHVCQDQ